MNILNQSTALLPGSDLWVLPQYEESAWTGTIDWMMNFIILKNIRHQKQELQSEMNDLINQTEFPVPRTELDQNQSNMLLILSDKLVPNRWVIHAPLHAKDDQKIVKSWIKQILISAKSLHALSVRVFIPKSIPQTDLMPLFDHELKYMKYAVEISFVQDGTST